MESQLNQRRKKPQSNAGATSQGAGQPQRGRWPQGTQTQWKTLTKDLLYHLTPATDVGRGDTKRHRTARLWTLLADGVERKDIMRKFAYKENALHTLWRHHRPLQQGLGPGEPLYFNDEGQPVYTYNGQCPPCKTNI